MTIVTKIQLFNQTEQHVLSIRNRIDFSNYAAITKPAFAKIMAYAEMRNLLFSDGPFVCFHNADLENLDVEMGFPLAKPATGAGEITGYTIPARRMAAGIFLGAYEETDELLIAIMQWLCEHGFEQTGPIYHYFLNDEEGRVKSELLTRIVIPVK